MDMQAEQRRAVDTAHRLECLRLAFDANGTKVDQLANAQKFYEWAVPDNKRDHNVLQFRFKEKSPGDGDDSSGYA